MTQKLQSQQPQPQNKKKLNPNLNPNKNPNLNTNTNTNTNANVKVKVKVNANINSTEDKKNQNKSKSKYKVKEKKVGSLIYKKNTRGAKRLRLGLLRNPVLHKRLHIQFKTGIYKNIIKWIANIKITPNNIIVALTDRTGKLKFLTSAGKLGLACSKRTLKFVVKMVLIRFFNHLKKKKITEALYFRLTAPKNYRRKVLKTIMKKEIRAGKNLLEGLSKLPFNGCRPPKARRKKRKGLRIFKT